MTQERKKLKLFLNEFLPDFHEMKKVGFWPKGIRKTDYEKIAKRYCERLGLKSIYEYKFVCEGVRCDGYNCDRSHPLCPSYPVGKFHPQKWKPLPAPREADFFFDETKLN